SCLYGLERQVQFGQGSLWGTVVKINLATVAINGGMSQKQPQTQALSFCGYKWFAKLTGNFHRNARTVIFDRPAQAGLTPLNTNLNIFRVGIGSIVKQINN